MRDMLLSFLIIGHFSEEYPVNITSIVSVIFNCRLCSVIL